MAQKDKVKELVGRGLHSYHTKALQQMDRIEKKNKEQNHKISILTNELDNDYLTKTEEGSVVSLEHSKEGMIYLDELQGNTLVNYCTDGSKEMTLNGDIDLEGTFVTTTEGVDNGLVDVMCEGNTLVNLVNHPNSFTVTRTEGQTYRSYDVPILYSLKANTTYTIYLTVESNEFDHNPFTSIVIGQGNGDDWSNRVFWNKEFGKDNTDKGLGRHKAIFTTHSRVEETSFKWIKFIFESYSEYNTTIKDIVLLEGEHNEDIDNFIGMKSVGQDDENGHKIEILSQNKNLLKNTSLSTKTSWYIFNGTIIDGVNDNKGIYSEYIQTASGYYDFLQQDIFSNDNVNNAIKNDKWYTFSFYAKGTGKVRTHIYPRVIDTSIKGFVDGVEKTLLNDGNCDWILTNEWVRHSYTFKTKSSISDIGTHGNILFRLMPSNTDVLNTVTISCPMLEEGKVTTDFTNDLSNKKEILLNEPLRGLPNGVKDRFVKIGGKPYIERNCGYIFLDNTRNWTYNTGHSNPIFECSIKNDIVLTTDIIGNRLLCDKLESKAIYSNNENYGICFVNGSFCRIRINGYTTSEEYNNWINNNSLNVVYQLPTPIYERLEIDPTLYCYSEVTHFSNNSLIPCNMKIKNSGYNTIIKPNTLYTVALDTNKSGTIGINLGGAKGTTTNNVLTLTTPATLTDDSLRLYGKGIKGSKVRLLEGDKTNWMPSHFEGMKSSFEDKLQSDGTYKIEILSNNQNLFDRDKTYYRAGWGEQNYQKYKNGFSFCSKNGWNSIGYSFESLKNKTVTVCATVTCVNKDTSKQQEQPFSIIPVEYGYQTSVRFRDGETKKVKFNITLKDNGRVYFIGASNNEGSNRGGIQWFLEDISVVEGIENDYVPRECNKIQFSSIEPLRGVGDIKDRFVLKDGKLMIERKCKQVIFNGSEVWNHYNGSDKLPRSYYIPLSIGTVYAGFKILCDKYGNISSKICDGVWEFDKTDMKIAFSDNSIKFSSVSDWKKYISKNNLTVTYQLAEPTYEEIPFELQKIILEGYENGTLFFDTNIPPTSTVTYAGETPIVKSVKLNKTEVSNNTNDINDNIIPYLMDMDYRVVCLQLESNIEGISMSRLFGGAYEMLKRDILSKRLSKEEYGYRLTDYFNAGKLTEEEVRELEDLR